MGLFCALHPLSRNPEGGLGSAPTAPLPSWTSRGERGGCGGETLWRSRFRANLESGGGGEAGGGGNADLCHVLQSPFPPSQPPGPACRLKGHRDPDSRWGVGVKGKGVKERGKLGWSGSSSPREGNPDPYPLSRGRAPLTRVGEKTPRMRAFSVASPFGAALHPRRFPGPLPKILTGTQSGEPSPQPPVSQPSHFSSLRLPPAGRIGPGGFLSPRTPPYAQHLLTARPATAPLSAGAGANPIYRPGQARPARMRRRLTPPDCALPSPARPPGRPARRALLSPRPPTPRARGPLVQALSPRSPVLHFTCLRGPEAGGSLSEAPPPRSGSPPLCFRISRQCFPVPSRPQLPDPVRVRPRLSPGLRPGGGGTGEHRVVGNWPSCGAPWLSR